MLFNECNRLRRYVNILVNKSSEIETVSENEMINEVEENITDPILKQKFSSKKSAIEALLDENNKMNKELETAKKENLELKSRLQEENSQKKSGIKFNIEDKEDIKMTSGGKKAIRKGDSKIVRQKTGYNAKAKKIISDSRKLEEEIVKTKKDVTSFNKAKTNEKVDHAESGNSIISYRNDPDWESNNSSEIRINSSTPMKGNVEELSIIKENEVSDCLPELRLLLQVFEDNAWKFLFSDKYLIPLNLAKEVLQTKLSLGTTQAEKLARYLIEPNNKEKLPPKNYTLNSGDVIKRIKGLVGKYKKYDSEEMYNLIESFYNSKNDSYRSRFINEMNDLIHVGKVSKNEFEKTVANLNMDINIKALMIMLMRDSNSLSHISAEAIKTLREFIYREEKNHNKSTETQIVPIIKQAPQTKYDEFNWMQKEIKEK